MAQAQCFRQHVVRLLNLSRWAQVRQSGRTAFVRRMATIGLLSGAVISIPLWFGAYRFYSAQMYPLAKLTAMFAVGLLPLRTLVQALVAFLVWRLNEYLFVRDQP